jgi:hypothetical protein
LRAAKLRAKLAVNEIFGWENATTFREPPETWVTDRTGPRGYTFSPFGEEVMPWKECSVMDERLQFVARWLVLSPKYKRHIRFFLYRLFDKAMVWELLDVRRNPIELVEVKGTCKRKKRARILQAKEALQTCRSFAQCFFSHSNTLSVSFGSYLWSGSL